MSGDNVTQFPKDPPPKPKKLRKPRVGLQFAEGGTDGPRSSDVFMALQGVCCALDDHDWDINQFVHLSAAAKVLVGILEDRQL